MKINGEKHFFFIFSKKFSKQYAKMFGFDVNFNDNNESVQSEPLFCTTKLLSYLVKNNNL